MRLAETAVYPDTCIFRVLHTRVTVPWNLTGCRLLLEEKLPGGVYVDPDELGRGQDGGAAVACVMGTVDVKAFEPSSRPLRVYVYTQPLCQGQTGKYDQFVEHCCGNRTVSVQGVSKG